MSDSDRTGKPDAMLSHFLWGHDDFREGLGENGGLSGNETHAYKVDGDDGASEIPDPVTTLFNKYAANRLSTYKSAATFDSAWNEPMPKAVAPSFSFTKNSDARLEKVRGALLKVFGDDHAEELEEAVQIAEEIRTEARAEAINMAVSDVGQRAVAKVNVDPMFAKLVAVDEGDEQWKV